MSPKLKPLLLPQLVEERRRRESIAELEMDLSTSSSFYSQTSSEVPSPVTPTFSRGHFRYPSSASSIESPFNTTLFVESPSASPIFVPQPSKRLLPDVQEEPHNERDEDFDMFDDSEDLYDCLCKSVRAAKCKQKKQKKKFGE